MKSSGIKTAFKIGVALTIAMNLSWICAAEQTPTESIYHTNLTGVYQALIAESSDGTPARLLHNLTVGNQHYELLDFENDKLKTGDTISVSAIQQGSHLRVTSHVRLDIENRNSSSVSSGSRNVAIIYLNFTDKDLHPQAFWNVPESMYSDRYSPIDLDGNDTPLSEANVKAAIELSSFNQLTLNPDANGDGEYDTFGPYDLALDSTTCGLYQAWANAGDLYATLDGADLSMYQHRMYIVPQHACNWNGLAIIGCGDNCRAWSRSFIVHTLSHELGHNFGLRHAAADTNGNGNIETNEQASDLGVMMSSGNNNWSGYLMHAPHRYAMGWFDQQPDSLSRVDSTATYFLNDLDNSSGIYPQSLVLDLDVSAGSRKIFISYRQGNLDQYEMVVDYFSPDPMLADTIRVHECIDSLCRTPKLLATLSPGETYLDIETGIDEFPLMIAPVGVGEDIAQVDIYYGDEDDDGVPDYADNCYTYYNPTQLDTDCDGFGNRCDADFNNDGSVNTTDLGILRLSYFSGDALTDLNEDGVVNAADLGLFQLLFFKPPGPAGPLTSCPTNQAFSF